MYTYQESINLCKQNLSTCPKNQLYQLGRFMGIPLDVDHDELATIIATRLINKHWKYANHPNGSNQQEGALPYDGDIIAAMRAQDRDAIRSIQEWRATQEAERSRHLMQQEQPLPEQATDCNNPIDIISQEKWSTDNLPDYKIVIMDENNNKLRTICLGRDSTLHWINDPNHQFSVWVPNVRRNYNIDNNGHGGGPGKTTITQLPDQTFIFNPELLQESIIGTKTFLAYPVATNLRIGNKTGTFGIGQLHGQTPGYTVYLLTKPDNSHEALRVFFTNNLLLRDSARDWPQSIKVSGSNWVYEIGLYLLSVLPFNINANIYDMFITNLISDAITTDPDLDHFNNLLDDLNFMQTIPELKDKYDDLYEAIYNDQDADYAAQLTKELFDWSAQQKDMKFIDKDGNIIKYNKAIHDIYSITAEHFYPDWGQEYIIDEFISPMTIKELIKNTQILLHTIPAITADYDNDTDDYHRLGPD